MIKQQTPKNKVWRDEQGLEIPYARTTEIERIKERSAFQLAENAIKINKQLAEFRETASSMCGYVYECVMTAKERKQATKGNFVWYNFDGSIKIEVAIQERIDFDDMLIEKCKLKLMEMVKENISKDNAWIEQMITGAFQTSKGRLDTKKIMSLKKYATRITDKRYTEAMKYLDESIRRPDSKTYFRFYVKDEAGEFQNIDLNFSSI